MQRSASRQTAPAADRNKDAILAVLRAFLPTTGLVLEIASGTGQHAVHFAGALPNLTWQPSDPDPGMRSSIAAWIAEGKFKNIRLPLYLDVHDPEWPIGHADAILCINMIHIAPWGATTGLFSGAARVTGPDGIVILYGPYKRFGHHTAPSNAAFDHSLRQRNPEWGVRDLEEVETVAEQYGYIRSDIIAMPTNNYCVIFRRAATS